MAENRLPTDYPDRVSLAKGGLTTRELVRAATDEAISKATGLSAEGVRAIREYENSRPETNTPPATSTPPTTNTPPATGQTGNQRGAGANRTPLNQSQKPEAAATSPAASSASQTEKLNFAEAYIFKGVIYGPGSDIEVPKELADTLRQRNLVAQGGHVHAQSHVGGTVAAVPVFAAPDQNFANEQLAAGFPGRELLANKKVTTRSELMRMSDVDLLNIGATRELIGQIREALRMTQHPR